MPCDVDIGPFNLSLFACGCGRNADRYLDKRMRRRRQNEEAVTEAEKAELQYFDQGEDDARSRRFLDCSAISQFVWFTLPLVLFRLVVPGSDQRVGTGGGR